MSLNFKPLAACLDCKWDVKVKRKRAKTKDSKIWQKTWQKLTKKDDWIWLCKMTEKKMTELEFVRWPTKEDQKPLAILSKNGIIKPKYGRILILICCLHPYAYLDVFVSTNTWAYLKISKSMSEYDPTYFTFWKYVFVDIYKHTYSRIEEYFGVFVQLYTETTFMCTYLDVLRLAFNFSKVRKYVFHKYVVIQSTNMIFINTSGQKANTPIFD